LTTDDGTPYYFNRAENVTTWERPAAQSVAPAPPPAAAAPAPDALPDGWEALTTDSGQVYYYNAAEKITQWERPE
jgi:hypothetical protein